MADDARPVLVLDFGAQYAQLIARRVRECHVYSEIVPFDISLVELRTRRPAGLVLSGGPASVYEEGAPAIDPGVFRRSPTFPFLASSDRRLPQRYRTRPSTGRII